MSKEQLQGAIINNQYVIGPCIGSGAFGQVYLVFDSINQNMLALKREGDRVKNPQLFNQMRIMKIFQGQKGFARIHYSGFEMRSNICIMDLLGPSLEDLLHLCNKKLSLKTLLMVAEQIINRIQVLHSNNLVYRDIKPENFLMGIKQNSHLVYLIDFGLAKKFRDQKNNQHISYKQKKIPIGTIRYSSINSQLGIQYSRRDDLEAIGYMLIYLATGSLPWQGLVSDNKDKKYQKILQLKLQTPVEAYTEELPVEFCTFLKYCQSLKFSERPDYKFLRNLFINLQIKLQYNNDHNYDWCNFTEMNQFYNGKINMQIFTRDNNFAIAQSKTEMQNKQLKNSVEQEQSQKLVNNEKMGKEDGSEEGCNEQNIDPELLQDSDMKLLSTRNRWFQSTM